MCERNTILHDPEIPDELFCPHCDRVLSLLQYMGGFCPGCWSEV